MNVKVKQKIPLKIKRMGINGEGIGFYKKTLVFVPGALKGEDIFCQITSVKKNFAEAKLLSVNKASKYRVTPMCDIYETCGGCQIMHLKYDKQLEFKTDLLQQEARGDNVEVGFIMVHGQDHLMTTLLLKDIVGTLMDVYKK